LNILVTGGAGYIGSHTCKALAKAGFTPISYDNLSSGHEWAVKWGPLAKGDILDRARLEEVFLQYKPSAVMHFAAYADVGESVAEPLKYYRNNVAGTLNLLEVMRDHRAVDHRRTNQRDTDAGACHHVQSQSACSDRRVGTRRPVRE